MMDSVRVEKGPAQIEQEEAGVPASVVEAREAASSASLSYVSDAEPGITRQRKGKSFTYLRPDGKPVRDRQNLDRIRKLAIPPAYEQVWICADPEGHIQATGRDARGRKQYRYHPKWTAFRDSTKYEHMVAFGGILPGLRERISADMAKRGLAREKVLATVVHLLETTLIRVGNEDYAKENKSFGLTTLRGRHVAVTGDTLRFDFKGKSGKVWRLKVRDRRIARVIRACQDLPGQNLFQYLDEDGARQSVTSADINAYLREITGKDITAKDFRTWAGTVLAAVSLAELADFDSAAMAKRNIKAAVESVAARLGNTPTICRKCYIHPEVLAAYLDRQQIETVKAKVEKELTAEAADLRPEEAALLGLLSRRLQKDLAKSEKHAA